ncbi:MAG TPA: fumarylacetoacetate hydrolase family protein, partial [Pirellulaceae bacterium]|nr:fumarylacetoacetate hydrolase family protein [Pirellulaceae bacterium]
MKIARFDLAGDVDFGVVDEAGNVRPLKQVSKPCDLFSQPIGQVAELVLERDLVRLLAPQPQPEKIVCIGKNYADHAREMGGEAPELPIVFSKFNSALIGPDEEVCLPSISQQVDFEAELVVVLGKPGRNIPEGQARDHIFGYTCGNDISARDWQKGRPGGQWLLGKTFDSFAPLGPWIVTADEIPDPHNLGISLRLNGEVMQTAHTSQMIYTIDFLISHLSQFFTWQPGDLLFTGTPA